MRLWIQSALEGGHNGPEPAASLLKIFKELPLREGSVKGVAVKIECRFGAFIGLAVLTLACRSEENSESQGSDEQASIADVSFCAREGVEKCRGSDEIVKHANELGARSYYFRSDPCATDGQRDAFRHIYGMVWITSVYGEIFAQKLSDFRDPEPRNEKNPQIVCQRQMDRRNNAFAARMARKIMADCKVPLSSPSKFDDYKKYQSIIVVEKRERTSHPDRYTDCVAGEVADYMRKSRSGDSQGPVVIDRDPQNATKCWLVPASQEVSERGRTQCDY